MVRFSRIIIMYLVIGAVMWGGGAITFEETGALTYFVDNDGTEIEGNQTSQDLSQTGSAIDAVVGQFSSLIIVVWDLARGVFKFLNWPLVVLWENNAPPTLTVLLGGPMTAGFYLAVIRLVRTSA